MSAKHTPGPWSAVRWHDKDTDQGGWNIAASGHLLPMSDMDSGDGDSSDANARLISAAPDLLEALERLLPYARYAFMQSDEEEHLLEAAIERSTYAIAKAKGQS